MPRKYTPKPGCKIYRKPDPENLAKAIDAVKNKRLSVRKAGAKFNINYSVVYRHSNRKGALKTQGGQPVLNANEEAFIVHRIIISADWGYPLDSFTLRMLVKQYLDSIGKQVKRFKNNIPGRDWAYSFLNRHKKQISERLCQNIKRNRAAVSHQTIIEYFERLEAELKDVPPGNILNYDETNLRDDPGKKKVIVRRGCKYPERIMNSSKSSTSLMFSAAADGTLLPVYVVYKAVHLYDSWTQGGPKDTRYNRSKSGWFDSASFEDWVLTVAIPYFKNRVGKKVLIGDNLSSHVSMEIIRLCLAEDIHFIYLPPNSTHLTQPLDVAFFAPLKNAWRKILEDWKLGSGKHLSSVPKDKFPRLLKNLIKKIKINASNNIKSGFRKCGIVPINSEEVLSMLPQEATEIKNQAALEIDVLDKTFINLLKAMRFEDAAVKPKKKTKLNVPAGKSVAMQNFDCASESSDCDANAIDKESDCESVLGESDGDAEMEDVDVAEDSMSGESNKPITEVYPHGVQTKDINIGDWILVKFVYSSGNCKPKQNSKTRSSVDVTSKYGSYKASRSFIGQVVELLDDGSFQAKFVRPYATRDFSGFVYRYPDVEDVSNITSDQISGKLHPPEQYRRGLLKFDVHVE